MPRDVADDRFLRAGTTVQRACQYDALKTRVWGGAHGDAPTYVAVGESGNVGAGNNVPDWKQERRSRERERDRERRRTKEGRERGKDGERGRREGEVRERGGERGREGTRASMLVHGRLSISPSNTRSLSPRTVDIAVRGAAVDVLLPGGGRRRKLGANEGPEHLVAGERLQGRVPCQTADICGVGGRASD